MTSDCTELFSLGQHVSGVYRIQPDRSDPFPVYCDMTDGGWTVFMNRFDGSQDFYLYWRDYKNGFGNLTGEHWLGNDKLHSITLQRLYSMRMEVTHWITREKRFAVYDSFLVDGEKQNYTLHVSGFSGNTLKDFWALHNGKKFSTRDRKNNRGNSCAQTEKGANWYFNSENTVRYDNAVSCSTVHPTGLYSAFDRASMHFKYIRSSEETLIYLRQMKLKIRAK